MKCVESIGRREFDIEDVYAFEAQLGQLYPENRNVKPKIRQQLQFPGPRLSRFHLARTLSACGRPSRSTSLILRAPVAYRSRLPARPFMLGDNMAWFLNHYTCARCVGIGPMNGRACAMMTVHSVVHGTCRRSTATI